jgi:para-nitrobenzyl esterase
MPGVFVALALVGTCVSCESSNDPSAETGQNGIGGDLSTVVVAQGTLHGLVDAKHREFLGIPFGAPPLGDLRFRPPKAAPSWSGVREATQFGSSCPQPPVIGGAASTNEDCLYLNVYTPLKGSKLPVMVWIHGGGFFLGAGSQFDGATMANRGNVIVVTINYRLSVLGFLSIPGLAAENANGASGDYGLMDQQAALGWVKANVAKFGGDADNVTIFGESAGGGSVVAHLASPTSSGLFHKAVIQSGPAGADTKEASYAKGKALVESAGCTNSDPAAEVACMRAAPVMALMGNGSLTIDGVTLTSSPNEVITSGKFNKVPVLQGSNLYEGRALAYPNFDFTAPVPTADEYVAQITGRFGAAADGVLAQYPASNFSTTREASAAVLGDSSFSCAARALTRNLTAQGISVYAYEFQDPNPPSPIPNVPLGPTHGTEIVYVFQGMASLADVTMLTATQLKLSDQMLLYWTNFAHNGNPNGNGLPQWDTYKDSADSFIRLTSESPGIGMFNSFKDDHHCDFWATLGELQLPSL